MVFWGKLDLKELKPSLKSRITDSKRFAPASQSSAARIGSGGVTVDGEVVDLAQWPGRYPLVPSQRSLHSEPSFLNDNPNKMIQYYCRNTIWLIPCGYKSYLHRYKSATFAYCLIGYCIRGQGYFSLTLYHQFSPGQNRKITAVVEFTNATGAR